MLRLYDYINSSFDNRLLFGWGPKDMAWVDNGDGTISKKADPVLEGYNSYAEVRHTLSMGIKGIFLWTEEDNSRLLRIVKSSIWKDKSLTWTAP